MTSFMSTNTVRNALWDCFGGDALPLLLTIEVRNHYGSNTLLIYQFFQFNFFEKIINYENSQQMTTHT